MANPSFTGARLSHVGLRVRDVSAMEAFYTAILGLSLSDRGVSERRGLEMAFLTADPAVHHQLALAEVPPEEAPPRGPDHLAFEVATLTELRAIRDRAVAAGKAIRTSNHGNAWAIYFADPEGNAVEVFATSPFPMQQPFGRPFDLDAADAEILAATAGLRK